jgi:hypothetical protein
MVKIPEVLVRPDQLTQLFPGYDLSRPFEQGGQNLER